MRITTETVIGFVFIILASMFSFKILSFKQSHLLSQRHFSFLSAKISNANGITVGSSVKLSGIDIGDVASLELMPTELKVLIKIKVDNEIKIPDDSVLAVSTDGLFGGKFISLQPGFSEVFLKDGDVIKYTRPSLNLEELISKFVAN